MAVGVSPAAERAEVASQTDTSSIHNCHMGKEEESKREGERGWCGSRSDTGAVEGSPYYFDSCSPHAMNRCFMA